MYSFVTSMIQKNIVFASKGTQVFFSEHVSSITWRFYIKPIWNLHLKDDRIILKWKHCTSYTRFGPLERFWVKVISFSSSINLHKENRSLYCLLLEKNIERYYVMPGRRTQNLNHVTEGRKWQNFDLHFLWFLMWQLREDLRRFLWFLNCSFILCTSLYAVLAIAGFTMFGEDTASQITLNLPKQFFASKLATWTTVSNHLGSNLWYVVDNHLVLWASYGCRVLQFHEPKLFLDIRY